MNDIDQVLHRLAQADPAPVVEETQRVDSWTVLLDSLTERNGKMPRTTTSLWRRGPAIAAAVFVLTIGAVAVFMSIGPPSSTEVAEPIATTVTTAAAPTTTSPAVAGVELPGPGEPWDMLIISHDTDMGQAVPQMYVEHAEQILGVKVNLHYNYGVHPNASEVLSHIGGGKYPDLSDQIRQAEIIVLGTWPEESDDGNETVIDADSRNCARFISTTDPQPPGPTSAEYWQPYRDLLDAIYTEIWSLRGGMPTVLITIDYPTPYLGEQREAGIETECRLWLEAWSSVISEAAADHGAIVVSLYDILNGPSHDVDPIESGYMGSSEEYPTNSRFAPNETGAALIVDALGDVGFEPWPMP